MCKQQNRVDNSNPTYLCWQIPNSFCSVTLHCNILEPDKLADDGGELLVIRCCISWTRWTYQHHFGLHFPHLPYHLQPHFLLPLSVKKETCLVVNLSLNHPMRYFPHGVDLYAYMGPYMCKSCHCDWWMTTECPLWRGSLRHGCHLKWMRIRLLLVTLCLLPRLHFPCSSFLMEWFF
jgi:hypothetical protein